jgi:hypothetical protein
MSMDLKSKLFSGSNKTKKTERREKINFADFIFYETKEKFSRKQSDEACALVPSSGNN